MLAVTSVVPRAGLRPGAVSPLGLIDDRDRRVRGVLGRQTIERGAINLHPRQNEATDAHAMAGFRRFLRRTGRERLPVDFDALEAKERARSAA